MNKYLLVDFENNTINDIAKVETDFEENEEQTGSVACFDRMDLLNTLLKQVKEQIENYAEEKDIRVCSECGRLMDMGYNIGDAEYYCSDECLTKHMSYDEYLELYDEGNGDSYWTEWV